MSFWVKFAISEALALAATLVSSSKLNEQQKTALEQFIQSGNALMALF